MQPGQQGREFQSSSVTQSYDIQRPAVAILPGSGSTGGKLASKLVHREFGVDGRIPQIMGSRRPLSSIQRLFKVCFLRQSGQVILTTSLSAFDPQQTYAGLAIGVG
jgi:hypothetical protein